ncbi:anaphase-promoting complex subunit 4-like [Phalaenopsis equestris]|uniref:anaphase-promoting complex subunit 4-like n=1 Tax=Phalaenopsis equestris TaxID=78828 RepID=UPI0009E430E0|nr:anaphase-promoting complex subunit 4-like [Phalaenopsis equestris]
MAEGETVEMEAGGSLGTVPFQLQFDKQIPSQVKIAEWNPEKDLLAMVTEDNKILLHRFNWQRLWALSPGKGITSLCWRPDGKAIALGLDDGTILLHDVENGKLLRAVKTHSVAVICLNWEEVVQTKDENNLYTYEDRTMRFFPPTPRIPRMHGLSSGDCGLVDDSEDSFQELSNCSYQHFNVLCSGDKDGCICFSAFGIFQMGKINIRNMSILTSALDDNVTYKLRNASIQKVALSNTLCQLIVLCAGDLVEDVSPDEHVFKDDGFVEMGRSGPYFGSSTGLHCILLNTSIFLNRKSELHQIAQQASNIDHLIDVIRESLSMMSKQWSSAMNSFNEKFSILSSLIVSHGGLDGNPQDEFLSLLFGARTSPPLHQFLVNSLGEAGLKRMSKAVYGAGKELHVIIHEHLHVHILSHFYFHVLEAVLHPAGSPHYGTSYFHASKRGILNEKVAAPCLSPNQSFAFCTPIAAVLSLVLHPSREREGEEKEKEKEKENGEEHSGEEDAHFDGRSAYLVGDTTGC